MLENLQELRIIRLVAEGRSFREVANILNIDPSTVSKAINKLEQRMDVRLFTRTTRTVKLDPEFSAFIEDISYALDLLDASFQKSRNQKKL
ncbi:MAG: LysR family transcriptional regulator, partial [Pseudobacteriovorax sp.]|nr:LysR family transcriptional regulator [Pseudobacteriovorax sp.]